MSGTRISGLWGWIILVVIVVLVGSVNASGKVIYVDDDAYLGGNGQNWATPYRYLQDALAVAWSGDEIRVAQGIYKPDENSAHPNGNGSRTATFQLKNGVVITGGYAGLGEPNPNARDIELYETILSGDIRIVGNNSDNSFHIVTGSYTDSTAVLDGFTVTGGNVDIETGQEMPFGAGMFALDGSATLANCTFTGNSAYAGGGVCYLAEETEVGPTLTNCTFTGNSAEIGGGLVGAANTETAAVTLIITNCTFTGNSATSNFAEIGMGGALYHAWGTLTLNNCIFTDNSAEIGGALIGGQSNSTLTNCTFTGNSATGDGDSEIVMGGAFYNESGSATIINCIFSENSCSQYGGAISEALSSSSLYNCLFTGNSCSLDGGAMYYWYESRPNLVNCTFAGNTAPNGNAIACSFPDGGGVSPSTLRAFNCIFWDGGSEIFNNNNSFIAITYSDVQGGWPGIDNINADPLFVDPVIGDYHLLLGSPCIDTGDNSAVPSAVVTDLDGNPRIIDGIVDMGAYEGPYQGFLLSAKSVIVPEGGTATFTVAPMVDPLGTIDVTVAVESGDTDITIEAGGLLTFDSTNYSQPQTVTLAAAKDVDELHGATVILVSAPGIYPASITAYELDSEGPTVLYVDCDALGANDGSSWENAFTDLREGLSFAAETFWVREIRVAQGAYSPEGPLPDFRRPSNPNPADGAMIVSRTADLSWTAGPDATSHDVYFGTTSPPPFMQNQTATTFDPDTMAYSTTYYWRIDEVGPSGTTTGAIWSFTTLSAPPPMGSNESLVTTITVLDRTATFQLKNGIVIKGGYAGFGAPNADARDIQLYETILSGDIGILGDISDNSYHVVTGSGTNDTAVLDGFTITAGNANGVYPHNSGGGMRNDSSSPMLANCTFTGNSAVRDGGAMYNSEQSKPTLTDCTFTGNSAIYDGGAMCNRESSPIVTSCTFSANSANHGGGISNWPGSPILTACTFSGNSAELGGAVFNWESNPTLANCIFGNNSAREWGGAICNLHASSPTLANCTFSGNSAMAGGGVYNQESRPTLTNCILWGNTAPSGPQIHNYDGTSSATVSYSDVQGGWPGQGNIDADPCFVQPDYFGPISYWKLDEADGTTAYDSAGQNHGMVYGAQWTTGQIDGALSFDGVDDYVNVEDDITLEPQNLTVSAWVYRESTFSQHVILQKGSTHSYDDRNGYLFKILDSSNSYPNSASLCVTINNGCNIYPISNTEIQAGIWYHIAATYDGSYAGIYVNGVEDGTDISDTGPVDYSGGYQNFKIGAQEKGLGLLLGHFDGTIDEVAIYDRALSADEIQQHYQNGLSGQDYPDDAMPDYHLLPDSPCINAGDPDYIAGSNETDLDGKPRVIGGRIDMGAYEFNHNPIADAGPDRTVEAQAPWGATVTLDCSASSDADSTPGTIDDINDFNWYQLDPCDPNFDVFLGSGRIIDCNLSIGEHIILLEVIDKAGASDTNEVTIIVQDTTPPDINCPPDVTLECPADTTPSATGQATATDTCGAVTITHTDQWQPSCGNAGTLARTWTATDESGNTSTCVQTITVVDTTPPVITCPPDVTLQCPADTSVEANGSATAVDTCSSVTIAHSDEWQPACGNTGILTRTWTATDESGNSSICVQTITVVDTTPPEFEFSVAPTMLWPPDHKMVLITPSWTVSDECDPTSQVSLVGIVANEGDNTIGDGHTSNDIQIGEDGSIYLRSERSGTSDDRVYTITYQAVDECGNTTLRSATVSIPHDFKVLARIASRWLWAGPGRIPEDLNGDGVVNLKDIAIFANNWIQ